MADLRVAFWNVKSLCEPTKTIKGGPQTGAELTAKIAAIADTLRNLFDKAGPDLLGLAEVYTERILNLLRAQLGAPYHTLWEPCKNTLSPLSGLAVLARADRFAALNRVDAYAPTLLSRPRYLIAKCKLTDHDDPIFFVVNHWRSKFSKDGDDGASDRLETARALGDWLANQPRDTCTVVLGDFNAEPFELPFGDLGLDARRHLGLRLSLPYPCLYNTAWRFLGNPDPCETIATGGTTYLASRPISSLAFSSTSVIFDQLLVSARALRGGPISLQERSVGYASNTTIGIPEDGYMRPKTWSFQGSIPSGASDHFPLVATFRAEMETWPWTTSN